MNEPLCGDLDTSMLMEEEQKFEFDVDRLFDNAMKENRHKSGAKLQVQPKVPIWLFMHWDARNMPNRGAKLSLKPP